MDRARSAGKDVLDENTPLTGVPPIAHHTPDATSGFYFAIVTREHGPVGSGISPGSPGSVLPVRALHAGPALGGVPRNQAVGAFART